MKFMIVGTLLVLMVVLSETGVKARVDFDELMEDAGEISSDDLFSGDSSA